MKIRKMRKSVAGYRVETGRKIWGNPGISLPDFSVSSNPAAAANEYHDHECLF